MKWRVVEGFAGFEIWDEANRIVADGIKSEAHAKLIASAPELHSEREKRSESSDQQQG